MAVCGIYKITNKNTGACYIGQSVDIYRRLKEHVSNKYNLDDWHTKLQEEPENYSFEILVRCNKEDLDDEENYYIYKYNSVNKGYNLKNGNNQIFNRSPKKPERSKRYKKNDIFPPELESLPPNVNNYPYSMDDLTAKINISRQSIYEYMRQYRSFFNDNSIRINRKKWYNQIAFDCLFARFGYINN